MLETLEAVERERERERERESTRESNFKNFRKYKEK